MNGRIKLLQSISVNYWQYDLFGAIEENKDYSGLLDLLEQATENDTVLLRINSPGGELEVGALIIDAIKSSQAVCISHILADSASMASFIALACSDTVFYKHTSLMFHTPSGGIDGNMSHVKGYIDAHERNLKGRCFEWCVPFISKREFENMWQGHEFYVNWDNKDLEMRIRKHFHKGK